MAILKAKEVAKMSDKDKADKLKDLKTELIRANVTANKTNAKTKEIKRAIARILTSTKAKKTLNKSKASKPEKELKK